MQKYYGYTILDHYLFKIKSCGEFTCAILDDII